MSVPSGWPVGNTSVVKNRFKKKSSGHKSSLTQFSTSSWAHGEHREVFVSHSEVSCRLTVVVRPIFLAQPWVHETLEYKSHMSKPFMLWWNICILMGVSEDDNVPIWTANWPAWLAVANRQIWEFPELYDIAISIIAVIKTNWWEF